jgi:hypothetical protein
MEPEAVSASLEVPVTFSTDEPAPASLATRLRFVLAQMAAPVLILLVTAILALATGSGIPLACGQLAIVMWLVTVPSLLPRLGERLGIGGTEAVRLQHRRSRHRVRHRAHHRGDRVARRHRLLRGTS